jgi:phosphoglycerol transferase MdoB-like AlkP superfamily enzyme
MKSFVRALRQVWRISWLPLVLVVIFVIQNHLFNYWLNISPGNYVWRRSLVTTALGILLFAPALLINKRFKYPYLAVASLLAALIFSSQYLYYSYSGGFLQASALFYAGEGMAILPTVKTLLNWHLIVFAAGLLVVVGVWVLEVFSDRFAALEFFRRNSPYPPFFKGRGCTRPPEVCPQPLFEKEGVGGVPSDGSRMDRGLIKKQKLIIAATLALIVAIGYGSLFAIEKHEQGNAKLIYNYSQLYDVNSLVGKTGVVNFFLGDTIALALHTDKVNAADASFVSAYKAKQQPPAPVSDFGSLKGRNIIMIQVESLENAAIGQKFNGQEITPNLNKLAASGLYFSNYYSPIGPGTTADAEFMTLNSLYSLPNTVAFIQYAFDKYTALPALLKQNGYGTYSFHGDAPSFWNRANIYPQLGYEKWFSADDYTIPRKIGNYDLGDKDFFSQSLPKLAALPQPFMATLITLSSHTPFIIPDDLQTLNMPPPTNLSQLQWEYLQSIHYTDQAIGDFIDELKAAGLYDNSIILIYGDHGSFTGIAGALGVSKSVFPDLQTSQVPLIVLAPGTSLKGERTTPASHLDVYPTIADLLGIKAPSGVFGHDMIDGNDTAAISRNEVSGTVKSILTDTLAFHAGSDGQFADGQCLAMPEKKTLDISACKTAYDAESDAVKASDIMVKGNLISAK